MLLHEVSHNEEYTYFENEADHTDTAILLIHGFLGDPCQFDVLASHFIDRGYKVVALRLPGHGAGAVEFTQSGQAGWKSAVNDVAAKLRSKYQKLILCSHSMGGLLSILAAAQIRIDGLILISTPLVLRVTLCNIKMSLRSLTGKLDESDPYQKESKRCSGVSFHTIFEGIRIMPRFFDLFSLIRQAKRVLPDIKCSALIVQSKKDETVHPASAKKLHRYMTDTSRIIILEQSRHFYHPPDEMNVVSSGIITFIDEILVRS